MEAPITDTLEADSSTWGRHRRNSFHDRNSLFLHSGSANIPVGGRRYFQGFEIIPVSEFVFSFHIHVRLNLKKEIEFYACTWITASSEQQYSQTQTSSFLQFPVWKWTSSRKRITNPPLHLLWRHVRPILVSGELYEHCWLLHLFLHAFEFSGSHVTKNQSICFSESLNKDWNCMCF